MYKKILIANDGSEGAAKALSVAIALARQFKSALHMVSVEELPTFPTTVDEIVEEAQEAKHRFGKVISQAKARAKAQGVKLEAHILAGHAVPRIVDLVEKGGFDLLIVGYMGHSALYNRLIGSTTDRLVEIAPAHVLVVK